MKTLFPSDDPCARGCLVLGVIAGCVVFVLNWIGSGFGAGVMLGLMAGLLIWGAVRMFVCSGRHIQPGMTEVEQPLRRAASWGDHVHNIFSHEPQGETRIAPASQAAPQTVSRPQSEKIAATPAPAASPAPAAPLAAAPAPVTATKAPATMAKVTTPSDLIDMRAGEKAAPAEGAKPAEDKTAGAGSKAKPAAKPPAKKAPAAKPAAAKSKAAPKSGKAKKDDLKKIKGIGPVYEKMLHKLGYKTFEQVAGWTKADIDRMQEEMPGFDSRIESENWIGQAAELAKGKGA